MKYLYVQGFPELGCIHTGNIFVFENLQEEHLTSNLQDLSQEKENTTAVIDLQEGNQPVEDDITETEDTGEGENEEVEEKEEFYEVPEGSEPQKVEVKEGSVDFKISFETPTESPVSTEQNKTREVPPGDDENKGDNLATDEDNEGKALREEDAGKVIGVAVEEESMDGAEDEADLGYEAEATSEETSQHPSTSSNQSAKSADSGGEPSEVARKRRGLNGTPSKLKVVSKKAKVAISEVKAKTTSAIGAVGKQVEKKTQFVLRGVDSAIKQVKHRMKSGTTPTEDLKAIEGGGITGHLLCRLGGYENYLLGYKANCYQAILSAHMRDRMDVVMFGHVIYEMATGNPLPDNIPYPSEEDYANISDDGIRRDLMAIFNTTLDENGYLGAINQVALILVYVCLYRVLE